jgi:hypothetical protein
VVVTVLAGACGLLTTVSASADIVRLKNGRTMKVDACRFEGDSVILELPGGGET